MRKYHAVLLLAVILGYLGSYGGKLCIYNAKQTAPYYIFPYSVAIYPESDQSMLEKGIAYENLEELNRLIADYMS